MLAYVTILCSFAALTLVALGHPSNKEITAVVECCVNRSIPMGQLSEMNMDQHPDLMACIMMKMGCITEVGMDVDACQEIAGEEPMKKEDIQMMEEALTGCPRTYEAIGQKIFEAQKAAEKLEAIAN